MAERGTDMSRIVVVQTDELWTGVINEQVALQVPDAMDIKQEEEKWFAKGGGSLEAFVDHLVAHGAQKIENVSFWTIQYIS
jgi:hypothetical protein